MISSKILEDNYSFNLKHTPKKNHPRILIVEDDITLEPIWDHVISVAQKNATYDWATSEIEAERKIKEALRQGKKYDLVISDIFLSGSRTGIDLWQKYSHTLGDHLILVSGIEEEKINNYLRGQQAPAVYLKKPLDIYKCIQLVKEALE